MKNKEDIMSDIDLIVGRNSEVTDDTHWDLVKEFFDYLDSIFPDKDKKKS